MVFQLVRLILQTTFVIFLTFLMFIYIFFINAYLTFLLRPGSGSVCLSVRLSVCLSVCLCVMSVREHIYGTAGPISTKFYVQVPCGRGPVLLWRHPLFSPTSNATIRYNHGLLSRGIGPSIMVL